MKAFKWVLIFVGLIALAAGIFIIIMAYKNNSFGHPTVTNVHNVEEAFDNVSLKLSTADLKFEISSDNKCKVTCVEREKDKHSVKVENNTLVITNEVTYHWYENMFNNSKLSVTISLPKDNLNDVKIDTSTGDVRLAKITLNKLEIGCSTGDIYLDDLNMDSFKLKSSTGELKMNNANVNGDIIIEGSTGDVKLENTKAKNFSSDLSTGEVIFNNTFIEENTSINSSTGDVTFKDSDSNTLNIHTSTGDVTGNLKTPKSFNTKSSTGDIDVPNTEGGSCVIQTSTGDIIIKIK